MVLSKLQGNVKVQGMGIFFLGYALRHGPLLGRFKMVYCAPSLRIIGSIYINHFETPTHLNYVGHNPKKKTPIPWTLRLSCSFLLD